MFAQVVLQEEYACIPSLPDVRTILDGGANVGFSARYFLHRFPNARVIAVEADPGNVAAAGANLADFNERCDLVHGAIWPSTGRVELVSTGFRDGREWSRHVRPATGSGATVPAFTIANLMDRFGVQQLDLLKLDIEGAENALFASNTDFMKRVRCCAIELHDAHATELFANSCRIHGLDSTVHGETTVAIRRVP